ncbi:SpaA isopeptide-forming pilin-related protein [Peptostreptococcus equinus]|uniref:SpaA isopeptide-forming pilin-related protein n=1 Tax=Peptostreptococcus equinus TaxID=3003601 RepID=A0ABY7JPZ8_9FIRM|nr:SpaA isopeptide-forming pilin-related protein [Peptostreptococcus sp. CBA3647]WAW15185.1 SpaA isopeptide-forming pilin-related protein [Peptostreptococcus sp. CBA3647]
MKILRKIIIITLIMLMSIGNIPTKMWSDIYNKVQAETVNYGKLVVNKVNENQDSLAGATFTLEGQNGSTYKQTLGDSEQLSKFEFANLQPGTYVLKETKSPQDYKISNKEWIVVVRSDGGVFVGEKSDNITPIETGGVNVGSKISYTGTMKYNDSPSEGVVGSIDVGTVENDIKINLNFSTSEKINSGDYFELEVSDTLHYNMLQPDKSTYPNIYGSNNKIIAYPTLVQEDPSKGTGKVVRYTFTSNASTSDKINFSLNLGHSVNMNVATQNQNYNFEVKVRESSDAEVAQTWGVKYEDVKSSGNLNIKGAFLYTNDQLGKYTQLFYVNTDKNDLGTNPKLTVFPTDLTRISTFNTADISSAKTKVNIYMLKSTDSLSDAPILDKSKLEDVSSSFTPTITDGKLVINFPNNTKDTYVVTIDSEMKYPVDSTVKTALVQTGVLSNSTNKIGENSGISTNVSTSSSDIIVKPNNNELVLKVINSPINYGSFTIFKKGDSQEKLSGAKFNLKSVSGDYNNSLESDSQDGKIVFDKLPQGSYILTEETPPNNYDKTDETWKVNVDENGKTNIIKDKVDGKSTIDGTNLTVINIKKITANIELKKTTNDGTSLAGAKFNLKKEGDPSFNADKTSEKDTGRVLFDNLKPGVYVLTETEPPSGYKEITSETRFYVKDDGSVVELKKTDSGSTVEEAVVQPIKIVNELIPPPVVEKDKGQFIINKTSLGELISGATFDLYDGKYTELTDQSAPINLDAKGIYRGEISKGKIEFRNLPSGVYTLKETKAPNGYIGTDRTWTVNVYENGYTKLTENPLSVQKDDPNQINGVDLSDKITISNYKFSYYPRGGNQESTTNTIYPNQSGRLGIQFSGTVIDGANVSEGDYFDVVLDPKVDNKGIDPYTAPIVIYGDNNQPLAIGELLDNTNTIRFKFTNFVYGLNKINFNVNFPLFINRNLVKNNQYISITNKLANTNYSENINIDYEGYGSARTSNLGGLITEYDETNGTFTQYLYVNPLRLGAFNTLVSIYDYHYEKEYGLDSSADIKNIVIFDTNGKNPPASYGVDTSEYTDVTKNFTVSGPISYQYGGTRYDINFGSYAYQKTYVVKITGNVDKTGKDLHLKAFMDSSDYYSYRGVYSFETGVEVTPANGTGNGETQEIIPEINVENKKLPEYPHTGGNGTYLYTIFGALILALGFFSKSFYIKTYK